MNRFFAKSLLIVLLLLIPIVADANEIYTITIHGAINPLIASFINDSINKA